MSVFPEIITAQNLCALAGSRSYSRGDEYFVTGRVGPLTEKNGVISAQVRGSRMYNVWLKAASAGVGKFCLDHTCTCPVGRDGDFCKHCVAVGLAWIDMTAAAVDEEIAKIDRLLAAGFAEETVGLCEFALEQASRAIGEVDDSDGNFGYIARRLQELHLAACKQARPSPVALARRLFDFETSGSDLDIFSGAAETYKPLLGKEGLTEAKWAKVPAKGKEDDNSDFSRCYAITHIMESLARAEEGLLSFRERPDNDLRDFLAEEEPDEAAGKVLTCRRGVPGATAAL